ncbi:MAG: hypothetical protein ABF286_06960, partial [Polaribacter sp.]
QSNIETEKLDSLKVYNNAFIISKDSIVNKDYNQIKGRNMFGKFEANKLKLLLVKGNAESIYFNRNAETQKLETITKEVSSNIEFTLVNGEIQTIKYLKSTDGKTYPPSQLDPEGRIIKGFVWREDEQPKKKEDIFIKDITSNKLPIKKKVLEKPSLFIDEKTKDKKKGKKKTAISIIGQ